LLVIVQTVFVYTWAYLFRDVNFTSLTMLLLFVNVKHFDLKFA